MESFSVAGNSCCICYAYMDFTFKIVKWTTTATAAATKYGDVEFFVHFLRESTRRDKRLYSYWWRLKREIFWSSEINVCVCEYKLLFIRCSFKICLRRSYRLRQTIAQCKSFSLIIKLCVFRVSYFSIFDVLPLYFNVIQQDSSDTFLVRLIKRFKLVAKCCLFMRTEFFPMEIHYRI